MSIAAFLVSLALSSGPMQSAPTSNGRWQVVNGTPEFAKNIMLLDTWTGQTWVYCSDDQGNAWCFVPRTTAISGGKPRPDIPQ